MLDVAVIIVSWNVRDYLIGCLTSVYTELGRSNLQGEIWVVDNGSTDGTQAMLKDLFPHVRLLENNENVGFGAANNQGIKAVLEAHDAVSYFFLLNPDTIVRPGALKHLVQTLAESPKTGMVGARLVYGDGRFQHSAFAFPGITQLAFDLWKMPARLYNSRLNGRYPRHKFEFQQSPFAVDVILGAAMLVRQDVTAATQGFDESYLMYCEEIDWCWRIHEAGWKIQAVPQAEIVHFGGESTKQVPAISILNLWRSRAKLYQNHHRPWRRFLARKLAQYGLTRKASQSKNPTLQNAYQSAAAIWKG